MLNCRAYLKECVSPEIVTRVRNTRYCMVMNAGIHWGKCIHCNLFPFKFSGAGFDRQWSAQLKVCFRKLSLQSVGRHFHREDKPCLHVCDSQENCRPRLKLTFVSLRKCSWCYLHILSCDLNLSTWTPTAFFISCVLSALPHSLSVRMIV